MGLKQYFQKMKGGGERPRAKKSVQDVLLAWIGGFCGISAVWWINHFIGIQDNANLYFVGSFGASAVLIYGVPMGELSQPRNLVGGHVISAIVGVLAHMAFPGHLVLAAALAVGTAIAAMMLTATTHPPGGATALIAVIGGSSVHDLGLMYAFSPVFVGVMIMLGVAVLVNNLSTNANRAYPKYWF